MEELDLDGIPRIVVYNKSDRLEPGEGALLVRGKRDTVLLSALSRETTRGLIEAIAAKLAKRWEAAASVPEPARHLRPDPSETTTLDAMLQAAGKRRKRTAGLGP